MAEDWRFKASPHVEQGGLRAYAGVPLRFETEFGDHVTFGSLCVASNSPQPELSKSQQSSLARLADWIVADIIHSARGRRQRERKRMQEALTELQILAERGVDMEKAVLETISLVYPGSTVAIHRSTSGAICLEGGTNIQLADLDHGLWEDCDYFDYVIEELNHRDLIAPRPVRVIAAQCASQRTPTYLSVGSRDFRDVFDDIDSWFVHMCAAVLCRHWQSRILKEALAAKESFLRGITHQLRTPIHGILGSIELLTEELKARNVVSMTANSSPNMTPDAEQLDPYVYIKTIRSSARELITTVNSLIKLNQWTGIAQTQRDAKLHKIKEVEATLLNEIRLVLPEDVATRPSVIIHRNFPTHCDSLVIDMRLFLDCVHPLVVNAIQNTPGGFVAVKLSVTDDFQSLVVDVEDNGCGISPENKERIFGAYEKVDGNTIDAGLGLTLASKSAALLNGNVTLVSSEIGKGSHFRAVIGEQACASSFPTQRLIKERFVQLPSTFHNLSTSSGTSRLGHYVTEFLSNNGIIESTTSDGSLLIFDYTADYELLSKTIASIPASQAAICLIPDGTRSFIDFGNNNVQRRENITYIQAPILTSDLEEALACADALLSEFAAKTLDSGTCAFRGVAIEEPMPAPLVEDKSNSDLHSIPPFPPTITTDVTQSIRNLCIDIRTNLPPPSTTMRSGKPMALLVDDNSVNLRLLEMYCNRRTIPYRIAKDGAEAVRIFRDHRTTVEDPLLRQTLVKQPFDIVLMDLQMPVCDGLEATRQIRAFEDEHGYERSIICMVTGQDSPADRSSAEAAGSDAYLVKPVGPKVLDRTIKQWFTDAEK